MFLHTLVVAAGVVGSQSMGCTRHNSVSTGMVVDDSVLAHLFQCNMDSVEVHGLEYVLL